MKAFTIPVIIALLMASLCTFGALCSFNFSGRSRERELLNESLLASQNRQFIRLQQAQTMLLASNEAVNRFLEEWRGDFSIGEEMVPTFNELNVIATNHQVSQGPRNQDNAGSYTFKGKAFKVKRYLYSVSGDFPLLLFWLRDVERRFPLARLESVTINNTGQSLEMQTALVFPMEFKIP